MANQCQIAAVKNKQNAIQKRQLLEERWKAVSPNKLMNHHVSCVNAD